MSAPRDPLDTLAAFVATLLVRRTVDPVAELDPKRPGCFAHRVERHVLAQLYAQHGSWNAAAMATRGRPVGATIQRNIERHVHPHDAMDADLAREVQDLLDGKRGAWAALLDALEDGERTVSSRIDVPTQVRR